MQKFYMIGCVFVSQSVKLLNQFARFCFRLVSVQQLKTGPWEIMMIKGMASDPINTVFILIHFTIDKNKALKGLQNIILCLQAALQTPLVLSSLKVYVLYISLLSCTVHCFSSIQVFNLSCLLNYLTDLPSTHLPSLPLHVH